MGTHILVFMFADSIQEHSLYQDMLYSAHGWLRLLQGCKKKIERNTELRDGSRQGDVKIKK